MMGTGLLMSRKDNGSCTVYVVNVEDESTYNYIRSGVLKKACLSAVKKSLRHDLNVWAGLKALGVGWWY